MREFNKEVRVKTARERKLLVPRALNLCGQLGIEVSEGMENMKITAIIVFAIILGLLGLICKFKSGDTIEESIIIKDLEKNFTLSNITIINVYDNVEFDPKFKTGFGFACVIKLKNNTILFDTGGDSKTLLTNLDLAGIKPENINIVVLSHIHGDHTGGLSGFLEKNYNVKVYIPSSFLSPLKEEIKATGAEVVNVSNSVKIIEGIYSTGELGTWIKEQSLVINSNKGLIVITGCAHPGIVNIVKKVKALFKKDIYLVVGGFHHPPVHVVKELKELGVKKVAPSHCTGDEVIRAFQKEYQKDFIKTGVGKIIVIN